MSPTQITGRLGRGTSIPGSRTGAINRYPFLEIVWMTRGSLASSPNAFAAPRSCIPAPKCEAKGPVHCENGTIHFAVVVSGHSNRPLGDIPPGGRPEPLNPKLSGQATHGLNTYREKG